MDMVETLAKKLNYGADDKGKANYDFELETRDTFKLMITTYSNNNFLERVYRTVRASKKDYKNLPVDFERIKHKKVEIPEKYFNLINVGLTKVLRNIKKEVGDDNINILRTNIKHVLLARTSGESKMWLIHVTIKGDCEDNRK